MEELGIDKQSELANQLGYTSVSAISNWKKNGVDWNRVISKYGSIDLNYIITGERIKPTASPEKNRAAIERSWNRLEGAVTEYGISGEVRDRIISSLRDRARNLSEDLEYFSELIDRLQQIDE